MSPTPDFEEPVLVSFGNTLNSYLEEVKIGQRELALIIDVSSTAVNLWCNDKRTPARDMIGKIARAIDDKAEKLGLYSNEQSTLFRSDLGFILVELLHSAGFEVNDSPDNIIWNQITSGSKVDVRVGWMEVPPFASEQRGARLALDISETMLGMLGANMLGQKLGSWTALTSALRARKIDLIAPILAASPHHLATLQFSTSIGLMMRHVCLLPTAAYKKLESCRIDNLSDYRLLRIKDGGISDMFASMHKHSSLFGERFENLEEAVEHLRGWKAGDGLPPCIIVAEPHAREVVKFNYERFKYVRLPLEYDLPLPLAFGLPYKEPRLRNAVDTTVSTMKRSGLIAGLLEKYASLIPNLLVESEVSQPDTVKTFLQTLKRGDAN